MWLSLKHISAVKLNFVPLKINYILSEARPTLLSKIVNRQFGTGLPAAFFATEPPDRETVSCSHMCRAQPP